MTKERLKRPKSSTATSLNRDVPRMATAAGQLRESRQLRGREGGERVGGREGAGERERVDVPRTATAAAHSPSGTRRGPGVATAAAVWSRVRCGTARGLQRFSRSEGSFGPNPQNRRCGLEAENIADRREEG